jgi:hypothetical protein
MRVAILEFLDTDIFEVSTENCVSFLDPLIESWDVDLATFGVEIVLNRRVAPGGPKKFEFVETEPEDSFDQQPGFTRFLRDTSLSGTATPEEIEFLKKLKSEGRRIAVYGASAKGSTLLNYFGIGPETLDFVVDRSTVKQGRYTPGTHLKIYSPDKLMQERPDYVLLLSWNFAEEILAQQAAFREKGGHFIIPIPHLKVA